MSKMQHAAYLAEDMVRQMEDDYGEDFALVAWEGLDDNPEATEITFVADIPSGQFRVVISPSN